MRAYVRGWLLLAPIGVGVTFGGGAVLWYTPGPAPIALLALLGFVSVFGFAMYRLYCHLFPDLQPASGPITSMGNGDVVVSLKRLLLVVLTAVGVAVGGGAVLRYTPGPVLTDVLAALSFASVYGLGTFLVLRRRVGSR